MTALHFNGHNVHRMTVDGRHLVMHVPTTALFELDDVGVAVLDLFKDRPDVSEGDIRGRFEGRFAPSQVVEALQEFIDLNIVDDGRGARPDSPIEIRNFPLSTVVLNVNTGCNLACSYCYKEDLDVPSKGRKMAYETAVQAIDQLFEAAGARERVNVVFFGGEPLSNMPLIRQATAYARQKAEQAGKRIDFSLTTNGTLLTEDLVEWFGANRFGLSVSMDGPKALHDRNRRTTGGKGTYDVVVDKVRMLLGRYRSRPVGARVTLTAGVTDVMGIHAHLKDELGFAEVGFAPVTAGDMTTFNLDAQELSAVFDGFMELGRAYVAAALEGRNTGFSNMHQLMTDLSEGRAKKLPCGAGLGMLAVDNEGDFHLCHRFTGSSVPTFGSVGEGIDKDGLGGFLNQALERSDGPCGTCRARSICAGGCYHESYAKYGDPLSPVSHYCDLIRAWVDFGVESYARISAGNPAFFPQYIHPRSPTQ